MKARTKIMFAFVALSIAILPVVFHRWKEGSRMRLPQLMEDETEEARGSKLRNWTPQEAQANFALLLAKQNAFHGEGFAGRALASAGGVESFANGSLRGSWRNRGPSNQPGCWEFAEVDDGTDTVYGVTCGHYGFAQFIFKGTLAGDDFRLISGKFPNRYHDLRVLVHNGKRRLLAGIENGRIAYSDDVGASWQFSTGASTTTHSTVVLRGTTNTIYSTDGQKVYISTDDGSSFRVLKDFGTAVDAARLFTPRFAKQSGYGDVYLAREGEVFLLNPSKTDFVRQGSVPWPGNDDGFSLGGDRRKLYFTTDSKFWSSTDQGKTWVARPTGGMWGGHYACVHPENPDLVLGGYLDPIVSTDGLQTLDTHEIWGYHQIADEPSQDLRTRRKLHADNQCVQFFYDARGKLFSIRSSDGGLVVSYNEWLPNIFGKENAYGDTVFYNITLYGVPTSETYPASMLIGARSPDDIFSGAQDQGHQMFDRNGRDSNSFVQAIYGDGPTLVSADGENAWTFNGGGDEVGNPGKVYDPDGSFVGDANVFDKPMTKFASGGDYFPNAVADLQAPSGRLWILTRKLNIAEWNGSSLATRQQTFSGGNYVGGLAQSKPHPDKIWLIKGGKVFRSTDHGNSWDAGTATGMGSDPTGWDRIGMWVSPKDDNLILVAGNSTSRVVSALSTDGGKTWTDVSGTFPSAEVHGMVGTPEGNFVFASTGSGPYVFSVAQRKWFDLAGAGAPWFTGRSVAYIPSTRTVRFATWGLGIWDFTIADTVAVGVVGKSATRGPKWLLSGSDLEITATSLEPIDLRIVDPRGREIWHSSFSPTFANLKRRFPLPAIASGGFVLSIQQAGSKESHPISTTR